jgi:mono/diheme cytochrome c family protein
MNAEKSKMKEKTKAALLIITILLGTLTAAALLTLEEVKVSGRSKSVFLKKAVKPSTSTSAPEANLTEFRAKVEPVLKRVCAGCHGPKKQKGKFRVDTLNPDLLKGKDVAHWLEVFDVLSNGEMPPEDAKAQLTDAEKVRIVDWLSGEIQVASQVRRSEQEHSSFRRMTRYEYNYALQDLVGLPYDFAKDLPPETVSEDGFKNSSEMLHLTAMQFDYYRSLGRQALKKATVKGERPPVMLLLH